VLVVIFFFQLVDSFAYLIEHDLRSPSAHL